MGAYLSFIKKTFLKKMAYKVEYLLGILNTFLQIFISFTIWKVLYQGKESVDGITISMVLTSIVIAQGLSNSYVIDDQAVAKRVRDGSISNALLKPISFRGQLLAENIGDILFRLVTNFLPSVILFAIMFDLIPPVSFQASIYFIISIILGFGVLWSVSSIVQYSAFWVLSVWSVSTIKNVFVRVLSGAILPLWFMPEGLMKLIKFTPFDSIYFTPVRIYMGEISGISIWSYYGKQLLWILLLFGISSVLWKLGKRKVVVQGG